MIYLATDIVFIRYQHHHHHYQGTKSSLLGMISDALQQNLHYQIHLKKIASFLFLHALLPCFNLKFPCNFQKGNLQMDSLLYHYCYLHHYHHHHGHHYQVSCSPALSLGFKLGVPSTIINIKLISQYAYAT